MRSLICLCLAGCVSYGREDPPDPSRTRIDVSISGVYETGTTSPATLPVALRAGAFQGELAIPASIGIRPVGGPAIDASNSSIEPVVVTGWVSEYEIQVGLAGFPDVIARIRTPSFYAIELDSFVAGQATNLRWSPAEEVNVDIGAEVSTPDGAGSTETTYVLPYGIDPDSGISLVPASAFPRSGEYAVAVTRLAHIDEEQGEVVIGISAQLDAVLAHTVP